MFPYIEDLVVAPLSTTSSDNSKRLKRRNDGCEWWWQVGQLACLKWVSVSFIKFFVNTAMKRNRLEEVNSWRQDIKMFPKIYFFL